MRHHWGSHNSDGSGVPTCDEDCNISSLRMLLKMSFENSCNVWTALLHW